VIRKGYIMSSRKPATEPIEYLRALSEALDHIEKEYTCLVEMDFHLTQQKGVFCWHLTAVGPIVDVSLLAKIAGIKATYPNAANGTLEGFLLNQALKLDKMVAEFRHAEEVAP